MYKNCPPDRRSYDYNYHFDPKPPVKKKFKFSDLIPTGNSTILHKASYLMACSVAGAIVGRALGYILVLVF